MAGPSTTLEVKAEGVAVITLCNPPVNALHPLVLQSLFTHLVEAQASARVRAIVVTGANGKFSAGFDINQFAAGAGGLDDGVNDKLNKWLEAGPKPTVAAIEGLALGGGCEVALACNARLAAPGARIGLPELTLGIIPGFGGTQRLPRLAGLAKGVELILTSAPVAAEKAEKLGIVDGVVPREGLLAAAARLALAIADGKKPRLLSLKRTDRLEPLQEAVGIIDFARAQAARRSPHLQHPQFCLDAIQAGVMKGGLAGLEAEAAAFAASAQLDTHKALVHMFFAQRSTKTLKGITDAGLQPRGMKKVAVLGGGLMGSGICTALALAGYKVLLKEINQKFLDAGLGRIKANLSSRVRKGRMKQAAMDRVMALVKGTLTWDEFGDVDMVIEAAVENIPLKQQIFADLERVCPPHAILSTNTSTIDINLVGQKTRAQSRILGAHFFSPAHVMPLLEIVKTEHTSKQVILDTLALGAKIKKTPVVVGNCTGFAVNRVFFPYTMSACMLVDMGLSPYVIDKAIAQGFGMPMGPFRLSDLVGADIGVHVGKNFLDSFPERVYPSALIPGLFQKNMLGEKTGAGFYTFDKKRRASPNPAVAEVVAASVAAAGLLPAGAKPPRLTPQEIIEFIFFPVINEGCRVVAEGIVDKPADLDVASVLSMGFPPYRGGLLFYGDLVGAQHVFDTLKKWEARVPSHAGFFTPCAYLEKCARTGTKLGAGVDILAKL